MTDEEVNKYIDEWFRTSLKVSEIKSVSAQFFAWHVEMTKTFRRIWQDGYAEGLKEGRQQKTSAIVKRLSKEN